MSLCKLTSTEDEVEAEVVSKLSTDLFVFDSRVTEDDSRDHCLDLEDVLGFNQTVVDELLSEEASTSDFHLVEPFEPYELIMTQRAGFVYLVYNIETIGHIS